MFSWNPAVWECSYFVLFMDVGSCTHPREATAQLHKLYDGSAAKGTRIRGINIHNNTHEPHEE